VPKRDHSIDIVSQRHTSWVYARNTGPPDAAKLLTKQYIYLGSTRAL